MKSDIEKLSKTELLSKFKDLQNELLKSRLNKQVGQVDKPHKIRALKKDMARTLTFLNKNKH